MTEQEKLQEIKRLIEKFNRLHGARYDVPVQMHLADWIIADIEKIVDSLIEN
jgi:iron-sulfur cluster repair protein YtfE (RIC family)